MRIAILGCAGYIGSRLTRRLLDKGHTVFGVDNFRHNNKQSVIDLLGHTKFVFRRCNVSNIDKYLNLILMSDVIINLAALVGAPLCDLFAEESFLTNQKFVSDLVTHLLPNQHLISPCTSSGYGKTLAGEVSTEESPMNPISIYGKTKCEAEKITLTHPISTSLRLATVYGVSPRMRFDLLVNSFAAELVHKKKLTIYEPNFIRNFVHIEDVCSAFEWVLKNRITGVYNVGHPDSNISKIDLANFIAKKCFLENAITIGDGKDKDQRNCCISTAKLLSTGFQYNRDLNSINDLLTLCTILDYKEIKQMGNV